MEQFISDFEDALKFLSEGNNLQFLEHVTNNFVLSSGGSKINNNFITYQLQLHQVLQKHVMPIIAYLKGSINFENYKSKYMPAYRRLELLKKTSSIHIANAEKSISLPEFLNFTFFSYNDFQPNQVNMTLINNDNNSFVTSLEINSAINLINQLLINFEDKLQRGNNKIDINQVSMYRELSDKFLNRIEEVIQNEGNHKNDSQNKNI